MDSNSVSRLSEPSRDKIRQLFGNRNLWYLFGIACGAVATAYFSQLLFKQLVKAGKNELVLLKQRITQERVKSKAIVNLDITETHNLQIEHPLTKIVFTFYFMDNLKLKPTRPEAQQKTHPFLPPFEPGIFITNLSETHNLLFNKFCVVKNHCLVVTRKFENQTNQLNRSDFAAAFKVMRALEGFCFYNSGPLSGASQAHKHFQVMPYDKDHRYDIIKLINKEASRLENPVSSFECSLFKFAHKIGVIPSFDNNQDYQQIGESLETIYESLLKSLKIDTKSMSYNLILTESWILIVKRGKEKAFDMLSVNSLGFLGTFLLKDREQLDFVLKKNPIEILEDITYPSNSITNL